MQDFWKGLLDLIREGWDFLAPVFVVDSYQAAVVLRLGKHSRTLGPGLHWRWPLMERVLVEDIVTCTLNLSPQSLTTKDQVGVVIQAVITCHVADVEKLLLQVEGRETVLVDASMGVIGAMVAERTWAEISSAEFSESVTRKVHRKALKFGIEVDSVQFSDMQKARSIRLWPAG